MILMFSCQEQYPTSERSDIVLALEHRIRIATVISSIYYMALSHKDWELPNSWFWLAEIDIDRGPDFPI